MPQYEYYVQAIPPEIAGDASGDPGQRAAKYLSDVINKRAGMGWEFYRVESLAVRTPPGCLGQFLGQSEDVSEYNLVVFRKPAEVEA